MTEERCQDISRYLHIQETCKIVLIYIAAAAAFILALSFEYFPNHKNGKKWRDLAREQISYLSGKATGQSFIVGYGELWPLQPQHIGSSCPGPIYPCGEEFKERNQPNPQVNNC